MHYSVELSDEYIELRFKIGTDFVHIGVGIFKGSNLGITDLFGGEGVGELSVKTAFNSILIMSQHISLMSEVAKTDVNIYLFFKSWSRDIF